VGGTLAVEQTATAQARLLPQPGGFEDPGHLRLRDADPLGDLVIGQVVDEAQLQHQLLGVSRLVVLGVLPAAPVVAEPHHEAVVVNAIDRATWLREVRAAPSGDGDFAVHGDHPVVGVVGFLRVAIGEPRGDDRLPPSEGFFAGVVAILGVVAEQGADPVGVVGLPGLDVVREPAMAPSRFIVS
jgi:hypothetical protein